MPVSVFPQFKNETDNYMPITVADHIRAHYLLALGCPNEIKFAYAFNMMMGLKRGRRKLREGGYTDSEIEDAATLLEQMVVRLKTSRSAAMKAQRADPAFNKKNLEGIKARAADPATAKAYRDRMVAKKRRSDISEGARRSPFRSGMGLVQRRTTEG